MKEFLSSKISPIELAKAVRSLKGVSQNDSSFSAMFDSLTSDENKERIAQILDGTEQEDEFSVFCKLMETCESLNKIDQTPLIKSDMIAPDFIATFSPRSSLKKLPNEACIKYRCFIEVKLCYERKFRISKKDLQKRRAYAENYGLPLLFAIKFMPFKKSGFWLAIDAKELEKKGRKASIEDIIDSHTPILFDDYTVLTSPGLHIINYYKKQKAGAKPSHDVHSEMCGTYLVLPDKEPLEIEDRDETLINAVLDCFEFNEVSRHNDGGVTAVVSSIGGQMRFLSDLIYRLNNLAKDDSKSPLYNAARIIAESDLTDSPYPLLTRGYAEIAFSLLNKNEPLLWFGGIGDPDKNLKRLMRLGKAS